MCREEEDRAEAARKEAEKEAAERAATQAAAERLRGSALRRAPSTPGDSGSDAAPLYMPSRPAAGGHGAVPAVSTLLTCNIQPQNTSTNLHVPACSCICLHLAVSRYHT